MTNELVGESKLGVDDLVVAHEDEVVQPSSRTEPELVEQGITAIRQRWLRLTRYEKLMLTILESWRDGLPGTGLDAARELQRLEPGDPFISYFRAQFAIALGEEVRFRVSAFYQKVQVGMVFQKPSPSPKSISENVAFGPRIHGLAPGTCETPLGKLSISTTSPGATTRRVSEAATPTG